MTTSSLFLAYCYMNSADHNAYTHSAIDTSTSAYPPHCMISHYYVNILDFRYIDHTTGKRLLAVKAFSDAVLKHWKNLLLFSKDRSWNCHLERT